MKKHIKGIVFFLHSFFLSPLKTPRELVAPWGRFESFFVVMVTLVVLAVVVYGGAGLAVLIFGLEPVAFFIVENLNAIFISAVLFQVLGQSAGLFFYAQWKYKITLQDFGFRNASWKTLMYTPLLLFVVGTIFMQAYFLSFEFVGIALSTESGAAESLILENLISLPFLFFFVVILAPVVEEMVFRGYLLSSFLQKHSAFIAIALSSFIFAMVHINFINFSFENLSLLPVYFFLGSLLGLSYVRTKSLYPGIIFHSINNMFAFLLLI